MSKLPFLPYGRQMVDESDVAAVAAVLRSDWLTTGPQIDALEAALAATTGGSHAVACSSGTAGLHLACVVAGLGPGDAAIVPSITFVATANAVRMTGAAVVFADVSGDTGLMEPSHLAEAWSRAEQAGLRVRAVLPVDLAGQCADLATISAFARSRDAIVIEDACHAFGGAYIDPQGRERPIGCGAYSHMTVFSFHPVKTIAAGEGGAVTTNDEGLATRMRDLRSHGVTRDPGRFETADLAFDARAAANPWYYEMAEFGWNYRLSDIHAALALSQLSRLEAFVTSRRGRVAEYDAVLSPLRDVLQPVRHKQGCVPAWHLYPVLIDFAAAGLDRAMVMTRLRRLGIGTMVHYIPVHLQPYYKRTNGALVLPGAESYYARTLSLPLFAGMTGEDVRRVAAAVSEVLGRSGVRLVPMTSARSASPVNRHAASEGGPLAAPDKVMKVGMK